MPPESNYTEVEEIHELLPCPFCGGKAVINTIEPHRHIFAKLMPDYKGETFIECSNCTCMITGETKQQAVEKWNKRV